MTGKLTALVYSIPSLSVGLGAPPAGGGGAPAPVAVLPKCTTPDHHSPTIRPSRAVSRMDPPTSAAPRAECTQRAAPAAARGSAMRELSPSASLARSLHHHATGATPHTGPQCPDGRPEMREKARGRGTVGRWSTWTALGRWSALCSVISLTHPGRGGGGAEKRTQWAG